MLRYNFSPMPRVLILFVHSLKYPHKPHKLFWIFTNISQIITKIGLTQILSILFQNLAHTNISCIITKIELQIYTISMKAYTHLSCQQNPKGPTNLLQSSLLHNTHYKAGCYIAARGVHQTAQTIKTASKPPVE